jgi:hypothetical protein
MTYTAKELIVAVGQTVTVKVEKWDIPMVVKDAKVAYGTPRVLVAPVSGEGEAWVDLSRIVTPEGVKVLMQINYGRK